MASSTASSSVPSARAPSPSPSPRSMRFGLASRQSASLAPSAASTSSFLPVPQPTIPHSQADLDRLQMERELEALSLMSSSRQSDSSFVTRSSFQPDQQQQQPHASRFAGAAAADQTTREHSIDDYGSSVEFARGASPGANLSGRRRSAGAGSLNGSPSSFNTTATAHQPAFPSPVSTAGHHASAITLRTGLVGAGLPSSRTGAGNGRQSAAGFDDDREVGKMLNAANGQQRAFSFGLSDLGLQQHDNSGQQQQQQPDDAPTPKASYSKPKKLTEALTRSFSPARPASSHHHARVHSPLAHAPSTNRSRRAGTEESLFTTLARGVEDQLRQPLHPVSSPSQHDGRRSTSLGGSGGGAAVASKKKRDMSSGNLSRRASAQRARAVSGSAVGGGGGSTGQSLYLPDVTGLTEAVGETPMRAPVRRSGVQEGREEPNPYPLHELQTLQTRLHTLEAENALSQRRIGQLESELRTAGEREHAAREEWVLEREVLRGKVRQAGEGGGEWERRYWEVVEEKKVLEDLVASLRAQVVRLQTDLATQQSLIAQLQSQRRADQAELARRGEEVDRLRDEVRSLAAEVGGLRRAFEGADRRTRDLVEQEAQTSPKEESIQGLGFDPRGPAVERVREDELSTVREVTEEERSAVHEDERRSARASPVERPASRLSDGLRMTAAPHNSPPLPSSPRMADVLAPPSPRPRSRFASGSHTRATQAAPRPAHSYPLPASPSTNAWAASFEQEEPVLDLDEHTVLPGEGQGDLVDLRDEADVTIRSAVPAPAPAQPARVRTRSGESAHEKGKPRRRVPSGSQDERLPPQTVLARVLRELEDDYEHYKAIYAELADQYKAMDATSNVAKRNVLAEHLREVIDTLEQKGNQIASLYSLLTFADRPLPSSSPAALSAQEQRAFKSVKDLLRSAEANELGRASGAGGNRRKETIL